MRYDARADCAPVGQGQGQGPRLDSALVETVQPPSRWSISVTCTLQLYIL